MKKLYFISILAQEVQYQSIRNSRIPIFNMSHWLLGDLTSSHCVGFDLVLVFDHWLCPSPLFNQNMQVTGSLSLFFRVPNLASPINNPSLPLPRYHPKSVTFLSSFWPESIWSENASSKCVHFPKTNWTAISQAKVLEEMFSQQSLCNPTILYSMALTCLYHY